MSRETYSWIGVLSLTTALVLSIPFFHTSYSNSIQWVSVSAPSAHNSDYVRTGDTIYFQNTIIPNADPSSFLIAETNVGSSTPYSKDKNQVYFLSISISGADPATFTPIIDATGNLTLFSKDRNHVYRIDEENFGNSLTIIPNVDPGTFKYLDDLWIEDKAHVYDDIGGIVDGADPHLFTVTADLFYGKDKVHVFYISGAPLVGADPATFVSFATPQSCGNNCYFDAQDAGHRYLAGKQIQ